jgi:hypothetical protein
VPYISLASSLTIRNTWYSHTQQLWIKRYDLPISHCSIVTFSMFFPQPRFRFFPYFRFLSASRIVPISRARLISCYTNRFWNTDTIWTSHVWRCEVEVHYPHNKIRHFSEQYTENYIASVMLRSVPYVSKLCRLGNFVSCTCKIKEELCQCTMSAVLVQLFASACCDKLLVHYLFFLKDQEPEC